MSHTAHGGAGGASTPSSATGTADAAKEQAADVGQHAADSAQHVVSVAQEQAAGVAAEATDRARDLLAQGREQLQGQASAGQQRAVTGLQSLADELRGLSEGRGGSGVATHLAAQASDRIASVGTWLGDREPAEVLTEVQDFARRRPGTFLAIAAGVGLVAGRLTRGLTSAAHGSSSAGPSAPSTTPSTAPAATRPPTGVPTTAATPTAAVRTTTGGAAVDGPAHRAEPELGLRTEPGLR